MQSAHKITVICIPPDKCAEMWPHMGKFLLRGALECCHQDMEEAQARLAKHAKLVADNLTQIWAIIDETEKRCVGALITQILIDHEKDRKVVFADGMAGEHILRWGKKLCDRIEEFAHAEGCSHVMFIGRKALAKAYHHIQAVGDAGEGMSIYEGAVHGWR